MTELLVGSKKGLFVLRGDPVGPFAVVHRAFAGEVVEYAMRDRRSWAVPRERHIRLLRAAPDAGR